MTQAEQSLHINYLELLEAWNAVQAFCQEKENMMVLIWLDNSSAVAYINHMGGTRSSMLASIAIRFWTWALQKDIILPARHIEGVDNQIADTMSTLTVRDQQIGD
ncbi:MAG: hypothetical protein MJE68_26765 [Proteobacteria bacterium]|nr:hypothetical protein [Pseudomonadota bacterium]